MCVSVCVCECVCVCVCAYTVSNAGAHYIHVQVFLTTSIYVCLSGLYMVGWAGYFTLLFLFLFFL